jgi:hypothetical protein
MPLQPLFTRRGRDHFLRKAVKIFELEIERVAHITRLRPGTAAHDCPQRATKMFRRNSPNIFVLSLSNTNLCNMNHS